jgi:hypothetical protein
MTSAASASVWRKTWDSAASCTRRIHPTATTSTSGLGVSMVLPNGLQPFLNFRELVAYRDRSSHTVTVGLRIPF